MADAQDAGPEIIHHDERLLIVHKPPGLPTTASHLVMLKQTLKANPAKMIVHTTYQNPRGAKRLSQLTGIPVVELPYTVGGAEQVKDLFSLFDVTIQRLTSVKK